MILFMMYFLKMSSYERSVQRACNCCGCKESDAAGGGRLRKCSACRVAYYCGSECQSRHWRTHNAACVVLRANPTLCGAFKRAICWLKTDRNADLVRLVCTHDLGDRQRQFIRISIDRRADDDEKEDDETGWDVKIEVVVDADAADDDIGNERATVSRARQVDERQPGTYSVFVVRVDGQTVLCTTVVIARPGELARMIAALGLEVRGKPRRIGAVRDALALSVRYIVGDVPGL